MHIMWITFYNVDNFCVNNVNKSGKVHGWHVFSVDKYVNNFLSN